MGLIIIGGKAANNSTTRRETNHMTCEKQSHFSSSLSVCVRACASASELMLKTGSCFKVSEIIMHQCSRDTLYVCPRLVHVKAADTPSPPL